MSRAEFKKGNNFTKENYSKKIDISLSIRKNEFSKRKSCILEMLMDDAFLEEVYEDAKEIFFRAASCYEERTGKQKISLFKNRKFDYGYLRVEVDETLKST